MIMWPMTRDEFKKIMQPIVEHELKFVQADALEVAARQLRELGLCPDDRRKVADFLTTTVRALRDQGGEPRD